MVQICEVDQPVARFARAKVDTSDFEPGRLEPLGIAHGQRRCQQKGSRQESASAEFATLHKLVSITMDPERAEITNKSVSEGLSQRLSSSCILTANRVRMAAVGSFVGRAV